MPLQNFNDLACFAAIAKARSFTKAAAQIGVSQSALSQTIRNLEARLGLRLLTRSTWSAGPQLRPVSVSCRRSHHGLKK